MLGFAKHNGTASGKEITRIAFSGSYSWRNDSTDEVFGPPVYPWYNVADGWGTQNEIVEITSSNITQVFGEQSLWYIDGYDSRGNERIFIRPGRYRYTITGTATMSTPETPGVYTGHFFWRIKDLNDTSLSSGGQLRGTTETKNITGYLDTSGGEIEAFFGLFSATDNITDFFGSGNLALTLVRLV